MFPYIITSKMTRLVDQSQFSNIIARFQEMHRSLAHDGPRNHFASILPTRKGPQKMWGEKCGLRDEFDNSLHLHAV